jgi:mRNA guanylyltransferase
MAEIDFMPLNNLPKLKCILKDFFMIAQVRYIFNNYIPLLPHGNDGLIFTKNSFPYKSGTNENIVKWKPPEKNTIDFLICPNTKITVTNPSFGLLELYVFFS